MQNSLSNWALFQHNHRNLLVESGRNMSNALL